MLNKLCSLKDYKEKIITFKDLCTDAYTSRGDISPTRKSELKKCWSYIKPDVPHIRVTQSNMKLLRIIDFKKVTVGVSLFEDTLVDNLDLSDCDFRSLINAEGMFRNSYCESIIFDSMAMFKELRSTEEMFKDNINLKVLDLSMFDMTYVYMSKDMFTGCVALEKIIVKDEAEVDNLKEMLKKSSGYNNKVKIVAKCKKFEEVKVG